MFSPVLFRAKLELNYGKVAYCQGKRTIEIGILNDRKVSRHNLPSLQLLGRTPNLHWVIGDGQVECPQHQLWGERLGLCGDLN